MTDDLANVDTGELRRQLTVTETEIRQLKRRLRAPWIRPMGADQRRLWQLKENATLLCALRARMRGRYHLRARPRRGWSPLCDWNQERYHRWLVERALDRFGLRPAGGA